MVQIQSPGEDVETRETRCVIYPTLIGMEIYQSASSSSLPSRTTGALPSHLPTHHPPSVITRLLLLTAMLEELLRSLDYEMILDCGDEMNNPRSGSYSWKSEHPLLRRLSQVSRRVADFPSTARPHGTHTTALVCLPMRYSPVPSHE